MKEFRKDTNDNFICEECKSAFSSKRGLATHIYKMHHITDKIYFDRWIKEETDGLCIIDGNETKFINSTEGYRKGCCNKCSKICSVQKRIEYYIKNHGVINVFQIEEIKNKSKKTLMKKLGVENPSQSEIIKKKKSETTFKNYGVVNPMQSKEVQNTYKKTMNLLYNVDWPMQNAHSLQKAQKASEKFIQYKDTNIWYQASYEFDFLEKYYNMFKNDMKRGPTISYEYKGEKVHYHSDFLIVSMNLIIEVKSTYFYNDIKDTIKKDAVENLGYKYIMILDKKYDEFNNLIINLKK
jgi:hypothetical protein